ncbi:MAG: enolase C-terminal domain-like protein [Desulfosarcinaceae bacterium]|nr:enolase C-terminal domain-like protein [Desulfosarcinaceae bacterium]
MRHPPETLSWEKIAVEIQVPFHLAHGICQRRTVHWIRLPRDAGWGEATIPPYYRIPEAEMVALWSTKAAAAAGPLPEHPEEIPAWVGREGPAPARCALDMALHDRLARRLGIPLFALLGLPRPRPVTTAFTIPIAAPEKMAAMAARASAFARLKIKLGSDNDPARLAAIRRARPDARLIVDANAGWSPERAVACITELIPYGIELVEQPVAADDPAGMGAVQQRIDVPVMADESVCNLDDLERLAAAGIRAVNLKLQKVGGIAPCLELIVRARQLGMQVMLGCMIETSLGVTAMAHLSPLADWIDLDAPLLVVHDPFAGVRYDGARIHLPEGPGIGIRTRSREESDVAATLARWGQTRYQDRRVTCFDVGLQADGEGKVRVSGAVLTPDQAQAVTHLADTRGLAVALQTRLGEATPRAWVRRVVTDLRRAPTSLSERLNQALLGDAVRILEVHQTREEWCHVQLERDGYLGWLQQAALSPSTDAHRPERATHLVRTAWALGYANPTADSRCLGRLPMGLQVAVTAQAHGFCRLHLTGGASWWVASGDLLALAARPSPTAEGIQACLELVAPLTGVPYLWGGCTPYGYDCSGFTQMFWALMGIRLMRDADQQFDQGRPVEMGREGQGCRPGDLIFFGKEGAPAAGIAHQIPHVALSLGGSRYLHANGTSWNLRHNSLDPKAVDYREDLHADLMGARRYRR